MLSPKMIRIRSIKKIAILCILQKKHRQPKLTVLSQNLKTKINYDLINRLAIATAVSPVIGSS